MRVFGLIFYFVVLIALVILAVLFARDNGYAITVAFGSAHTPPLPIWIPLFVSFFAGVLASVILLSIEIFKLKFSRHKFKKSFEELKGQIQKMQTKPEDEEN